MTDDSHRPALSQTDEDGERVEDVNREPGAPPESDPEEKGPGVWAHLREYALVVVIAVVLSFLVKTFLVQPFWIPSGSMETTLVPGDRIVVNKLPGSADDVRRGDIVVFEDPDEWLPPVPETGGVPGALKRGLQFVGLYPAGEQHLVKRVIGIGGDHIVCCDRAGRITVNGRAIQEPYLNAGERPSLAEFDVRVPDGRLWVMGDNRGNSEDSRAHDEGSGGRVGSVPDAAVTGKVLAVVWPLGRAERPADGRAVFREVPSR